MSGQEMAGTLCHFVPDDLVLDERAPEHIPFFCVFHRLQKGALCESAGSDGDAQSLRVEVEHNELKSFVLSADDVGAGHLCVSEDDHRGLADLMALSVDS